ncbi:MAG TPA: WYL domain-containing protein [Steroidobacteraceae bacterium]|nr:WYL domain-containing protein [Steroidobacteraceae bacterium]
MDRTERFYRIQALLRQRRLVRTQEFLEELEVSKATFKRDLEYLKDRMHAPIVYDRHEEAYRFETGVADDVQWQLPGLWFTAAELQALLTMDRLLGELQPGVLGDVIGPLRKRLRELLETGEHSAADIERRIRILAIGSRRVEPKHFNVLTTALLSRRQLQIRHLRRRDGRSLDRVVSPQRLVHYRDNWYLDAWCHERRGLRTFAVDAIETATVTEQPAHDVDEAQLDQHFTSGYGIFAGTETQEAVLRFTAERARWVANEVWHAKQSGEWQSDGTYVLRLPYAQAPELVMDILRYGPDVCVLAPESLRMDVATKLREAAALY